MSGVSRSLRRRAGFVPAAAIAIALATLVAPPAVQAKNVGTGVVTGSVSFAAPGVPPVGAACKPTSFGLVGASTAVVVNTAISAYVGPVSFSGSGGSTCEGAGAGTGALTLRASGVGPTGGTLLCEELTGIYIRAATHVTVALGGVCKINNLGSEVNFAASVEFVPDSPGAGVVGNVMSASFAGDFVVVPA